MTITKHLFGKNKNNVDIFIFKLKNNNGIEVNIMNYGATITSILTPDKNNKFKDITLGFDTFKEYENPENPFFGATCGRYANRISNGSFSIKEKNYNLHKNDTNHSLHGGKKGFDKKIWNSSIKNNVLKMEYLSVDQEEGYPGNLHVRILFSLNEKNELKIDYEANTDAITPINLTNHSYFNLAGTGDILDQYIKINANKYTVVDHEAIPTGELRNVSETEMDLRKLTPIGKNIKNVQGLGYDHNFCLNNKKKQIIPAAEVYEPNSGRILECFTNEPGVQFYTGNFLNKLHGKKGQVYKKHSGFCLETQHFPDSPNQVNFPSTFLLPTDTYTSICIYKFGITNK